MFIPTIIAIFMLGMVATTPSRLPKLTKKQLLAASLGVLAIGAGATYVMTGAGQAEFYDRMYVTDGGIIILGNITNGACATPCYRNITLVNPTSKTHVLTAQDVDWDFRSPEGQVYAVPHRLFVNGVASNFTFVPGQNIVTIRIGPTNISGDIWWKFHVQNISASGKRINLERLRGLDDITVEERE
jgi:hypothetical protein